MPITTVGAQETLMRYLEEKEADYGLDNVEPREADTSLTNSAIPSKKNTKKKSKTIDGVREENTPD
ncbi:hypothetical protein L484_002105 [Morus notabilis]|uniref:Uncharacterized protein n=1 Tax=Morus notabilis TaxID=981085 RepID=W9R694_9ROSA|nr:hypothetical protein L484_002105 [Morus notabilis]